MTSSSVFYRKWRPQTFDDLVGQEPISRAIRQAIITGNVSHAYLFCGPRGTGKTSTARIFTKAVNCLDATEGNPCNNCTLCISVNEGTAIDLLELDTASNRGIDEIKSIRDKANYAALEAKYKVYGLDEAHMLTREASNALLKTLEEPPAHVIFILATTEPHRLTNTIISRCQRFDFRRISTNAMTERLIKIADSENVNVDGSVLDAITKQSTGSLRDAETLLEQAITSFGSPLTIQDVNILLGLASDERVRDLIRYILIGDITNSFKILNQLATEGTDLVQLQRQMVDELRNMLLIKFGGAELVAQPSEIIKEQSLIIMNVEQATILATLRAIGQINSRRDIPSTLPIELAILNSIQDSSENLTIDPARRNSEPSKVVPPFKSKSEPESENGASVVKTDDTPNTEDHNPDSGTTEKLQSPTTISMIAPSENDDTLQKEWPSIIKALSRVKARRFNMGALLRDCKKANLDGDTLKLGFSHRSHMERFIDEIDNPESKLNLISTVSNISGTNPVDVSCYLLDREEHKKNPKDNALVQAAINLGGKLVEEQE